MSADSDHTRVAAGPVHLATPETSKVVVVGMGASAGGIEAFGKFFDFIEHYFTKLKAG